MRKQQEQNLSEYSPRWKLTAPQLANKLHTFYGTPESSLPCSQQPATCPHPKLDELSLRPNIFFS